MGTSEGLTVLTVGHSTLSYERFLGLIRHAGVTAIADVRSAPYSRRFPHFSSDILKSELKMDGVAYAFLGKELGGRPTEQKYFCNGIADYEKMATASHFSSGIERVATGAHRHRLALMCSESDPLDCHRCLLVGRALKNRGVNVIHLLTDGRQRTQEDVERMLLSSMKRNNGDLFVNEIENIDFAYRDRSLRVAYAINNRRDALQVAAE